MNRLLVCCLILASGVVARAVDMPLPGKTPGMRIADRTFPSVFQAWSPADNLKEDPAITATRHDLIFTGAWFFGLQWDNPFHGLATGFTPESIPRALQMRAKLLDRNPNLVLLLEIRYRDAHRSYLPEGHKWWRRDGKGAVMPGWDEGGYLQLDFSSPQYREQVALQAEAAVRSGVVDGIMLDWWSDDADRLAMIQSIRSRIGERALILANSNDRITPQTARFINGYFMECTKSTTAQDWKQIADTLSWAEKNLRAPRINCLETWYHKSRADENLMRATTTLSLVLSDGYCLFSDPNSLPAPDHLHNWYPFWERTLGKPLAPGRARKDGVVTREFSAGTAAYNPMGNVAVTLTFDAPRVSRATGKLAVSHTLNSCDGDLFLRSEEGAASTKP